MATQARKITSKLDLVGQKLVIEVEGQDTLVVTISELEADIVTHAALHGLKQKICDAAALGASYSLREKYNAMIEVVERLSSSQPSWNKRTAKNGTAGLLFQALSELYSDKDASDIRGFLSSLDKKQQVALRGNPKIATIIEGIKSRAVDTTGIDSDELLEGLLTS